MPADNTPLNTLFIAECAINALSAFALAEPQLPGTIFLSVCGAASRLTAWLEAWTPMTALHTDPLQKTRASDATGQKAEKTGKNSLRHESQN